MLNVRSSDYLKVAAFGRLIYLDFLQHFRSYRYYFAVALKRPSEPLEYFAAGLPLQAFQISDNMHFTAAAGVRHIDPVGIVNETDTGMLVAADIADDYNIAFAALEAVYCRDPCMKEIMPAPRGHRLPEAFLR